MELNIRGEKIDITPAIREYIESKLSKLDVYFENPEEIKAHVLVKVRGNGQKIEVTVPTKKYTLRAEEDHKDLYASIDLVVDKLERQIRKNKTRLTKYKHEHNINMAFDNLKLDDLMEEEATKIVKRKKVEGKPMDEEEAILQMELLNHDFFVFKNIDEGCMSVIYLRKDGQYGIINIE